MREPSPPHSRTAALPRGIDAQAGAARRGGIDATATSIGIAILLVACAIELGLILRLNRGVFSFTLDDPYIHLALAQNLAQGHYGVNLQELSAPSSSILWPVLLVPIAEHPLAVLGLNLVLACASLVVFTKAVALWPIDLTERHRRGFVRATTLLFVLAANQVGLIYLGMEHNLQVLCAVLLAYGLLRAPPPNPLPAWIWPVVALSGLVRYEMAALSVAVLCVGWLRGQRRAPIVSALVMTGLLLGFSGYLHSVGLGVLPSSVRAKVGSAHPQHPAWTAAWALLKNFAHPQGLVMTGSVLWLITRGRRLAGVTQRRDVARHPLALALVVACGCHFLAGKYGWYNRYEVYIWAFFITLGGALLGHATQGRLASWVQRYGPRRCLLAYIVTVSCVCVLYLWTLVSTPLAANNIFEQQYQMHRLVTQHYRHPVAVNDLGWVAYRNPNYVLDLWGLGSETARTARFADPTDTNWMQQLAQQHDVRLVMVYDPWFAHLPASWQRVGSLSLGSHRVTPAHAQVIFYSTAPRHKANLCEALHSWALGLPAGVTFESTCP